MKNCISFKQLLYISTTTTTTATNTPPLSLLLLQTPNQLLSPSSLSSSETTQIKESIKRKEVNHNHNNNNQNQNVYKFKQNRYYSTTTPSLSSNKVYSWGSGLNGKLGFGLFESKVIKPKEIIIEDNNNNKKVNIDHVTCGTTFSIFTGFDNNQNREIFYGCGDNRDAQLIIGNGKVQSVEDIQVLESPVLLEQINGKKIKQLVSGTYHNACLFTDGTTLLWGAGNSGQIGSDIYSRVQYDPFINKTLFDIGIDKISLGATFSIAQSKDGKLYSFGSASFNELGNGDMFNERVPKLINNQLLNSHRIVDISCGFFHSLALTSDNKVLTWGRNHESQCFTAPTGTGKGSFTNVLYLDTSVLSSDDGKIIQIGANNFNSYILTESGNIYSIGANEHGQLGVEKGIAKKGILNKVDIGDSKVKKFYTGFKSIIVETADERFYGWGSNLDHQLTLEKRANYFTPIELSNLNQLNKEFKIDHISISLSHCVSLVSERKSII